MENGTQFVGSSAAVELDTLKCMALATPTEKKVIKVTWMP